jgi:hypothetical protein
MSLKLNDDTGSPNFAVFFTSAVCPKDTDNRENARIKDMRAVIIGTLLRWVG